MTYSTAFRPADILLPEGCDMTRWSVVACDQYTSEPEYWEEVDSLVGGSPSALRLILPEIYLGREDTPARIRDINRKIREYLNNGAFREYKNAMIYVERVQSDGKVRRGIVGAIDLEQYDYRAGSKSAVRATEATVVERIPPRLEIRKDAEIELPHIMILIDDPKMTVVEPLAEKPLEKLYDFQLMQGGGSIAGYLLREGEIAAVDSALAALQKNCEMLFAMGDGNHSLATAKEHYEKLKRENPDADLSNHPARYALCEIVNLHSEALEFEAIHRIVNVKDPEKMLFEMSEALHLSGMKSEQSVTVHRGNKHRTLYILKPTSKLAVGSVQNFLDDYLKRNGGTIDYIHGADVLKRLAEADGAAGFELEAMRKEDLFPAVVTDGALPRKTFSMGHAADKRYYLEARKITE